MSNVGVVRHLGLDGGGFHNFTASEDTPLEFGQISGMRGRTVPHLFYILNILLHFATRSAQNELSQKFMNEFRTLCSL